MPPVTQFKNYNAKLRREKYGQSVLSVSELIEILSRHSLSPMIPTMTLYDYSAIPVIDRINLLKFSKFLRLCNFFKVFLITSCEFLFFFVIFNRHRPLFWAKYCSMPLNVIVFFYIINLSLIFSLFRTFYLSVKKISLGSFINDVTLLDRS